MTTPQDAAVKAASALKARPAAPAEPDLIGLREAATDLLIHRDHDAQHIGYRRDLWDVLRAVLESQPTDAAPKVGDVEFVPVHPLTFTYRNWKGEVSVRRVQPIEIRFAATSWHPVPQYLLRAFDVDKGDIRDFAWADISPAASGVVGPCCIPWPYPCETCGAAVENECAKPYAGGAPDDLVAGDA